MAFEITESARNNRSSDSVVRIISKDNGTFHGNVENIQSGQVRVFRSFMKMCSLIQQKLDEHAFPPKAAVFCSWKDRADFHWSIGGEAGWK